MILAVCGGYQLLGHCYQLGDESLPGVGLVDLHTVRADGPRLIGNVAIEVELQPGRTGGSWPASRTTAAAPTSVRASGALGTVLKGHGNNGSDGREGVIAGKRDRHLPARAAAARRTPGSPTG